MNQFVKGYITDAGLDIIMTEDGAILPGFSKIALPAHYKPAPGEVAIVSARTSTLNAGIFTPIGLIDAGYEGKISAWVFNCSGVTYYYKAGDRLFSVVNLKLAPSRMKYKVMSTKARGSNNNGSTGGH